MPNRQRSISDCESGVFPSSGGEEMYHRSSASSPKSWKISGRKTNPSVSRKSMKRRDRYSSGYGSLDESSDVIPDSPTRSSTRPHKTQTAPPGSPPPRYRDVSDVPEYVRLPSAELGPISDIESTEFRESEEDWSVGSARLYSTVVECPDELEVTRLKTSGRDGIRLAPDMILQGDRYDLNRSPLRLRVNGEFTEYERLQLANGTEALERLRNHSKKHVLWCTKAVEKCRIIGSDVTAVFRYRLMTLYDQREFVERTRPYTGQKFKTYHKPRSAYDYEVDLPSHFRAQSVDLEIRNTERLKGCRNCNESGKMRCKCGTGSVTCGSCHGQGYELMSSRQCMECNGGYRTCSRCHGSQRMQCSKCEGKGRVVAFDVLRVHWKVKRSKYCDQVDEVPDEHLTEAAGEKVYSKCGKKLSQIEDGELLHEGIREFSRVHLDSHNRRPAKVVKQKHVVDILPIQAVDCCYKDKRQFRFYIVGLDRRIYAPDFPKKRFSAVTSFFS